MGCAATLSGSSSWMARCQSPATCRSGAPRTPRPQLTALRDLAELSLEGRSGPAAPRHALLEALCRFELTSVRCSGTAW